MSFSILFNPFFIFCLITGLIFSISGWLFNKYPPKRINDWYGYRTPSSKKTQERWDFAQKYAAKEMIKLGLLLLFIGCFGTFIPQDPLIGTLTGILVMVVLVMVLLFRVESALKAKFTS